MSDASLKAPGGDSSSLVPGVTETDATGRRERGPLDDFVTREHGNQTERPKWCVCGYGMYYPWLCKCWFTVTATGRPS